MENFRSNSKSGYGAVQASDSGSVETAAEATEDEQVAPADDRSTFDNGWWPGAEGRILLRKKDVDEGRQLSAAVGPSSAKRRAGDAKPTFRLGRADPKFRLGKRPGSASPSFRLGKRDPEKETDQ